MTRFELKITLMSILVGIIGSVVTIYSLVAPDKNEAQSITFISNSTTPLGTATPPSAAPVIFTPKDSIRHESIPEPINGTVRLVISATGADIQILEGDPNFPYQGGVVSSTSAEQTIYLPRGQRLSVDLSGTGAKLAIDRSVARQVSVNNSGVGADVSMF